MKKIIYIVQKIKDWHIEELKKIGTGYDFICSWKEELPKDRLSDIEIILGGDGRLTNQILSLENHSLKWVQVHSAGIDYLDLDELQRQDVLLSNARGLHGRPIAEHVMAVLLSDSRAIRESIQNQSSKKWDREVTYGSLEDKKMLIFGTGHVGREIAKLARVFGLRVNGVNRSGSQVQGFADVVASEKVDKIMGEQDIIVNILPATEKTFHFFDAEMFAKMKQDVTFINAGRGSTVDTTALIDALKSRKIGFANLDVFEQEPLPRDDLLWSMENVLITPHIAGMVPHFRDKLTEIYAKNLTSYMKTGQIIENKIDHEKGF